jgi:hypothetical protein
VITKGAEDFFGRFEQLATRAFALALPGADGLTVQGR